MKMCIQKVESKQSKKISRLLEERNALKEVIARINKKNYSETVKLFKYRIKEINKELEP